MSKALAVAALGLALAGCGEDPPALPPLAQDALVLAFGDSLTHGTGARPHESYPAVLAGRIGRDVVNAGVPGEVSAKGLARLERELDKRRPALLIICHGGNDILRKVDPEETERNLSAMIGLARERGVSVVMIAVPSIGLFLSPADVYGEVAEAAGVPLEDEILAEILGDNRYKSDHVHPNAAGYARMAEAIEALLRSSGAI
ncbi:MAG: arylesterase [Gammaproteobacteria bacterium]|nr:arylesterase [Gammaproteobacteria bacterium]